MGQSMENCITERLKMGPIIGQNRNTDLGAMVEIKYFVGVKGSIRMSKQKNVISIFLIREFLSSVILMQKSRKAGGIKRAIVFKVLE
jgi:hypothetical protein